MRVGLALAVCAVSGCDDALFGVADEAGAGPSDVGMGLDGVTAIVEQSCATAGCHNAETANFGLDLETDLIGATVDVVGAYGMVLIAPGDAAGSLFYTKMVGTNPVGTGGLMPPGVGLDADLIAVVEEWIDDGAREE